MAQYILSINGDTYHSVVPKIFNSLDEVKSHIIKTVTRNYIEWGLGDDLAETIDLVDYVFSTPEFNDPDINSLGLEVDDEIWEIVTVTE